MMYGHFAFSWTNQCHFGTSKLPSMSIGHLYSEAQHILHEHDFCRYLGTHVDLLLRTLHDPVMACWPWVFLQLTEAALRFTLIIGIRASSLD